MVVTQTSFASHRLTDRDSGLFGKVEQGFRGFAVNDTATGDDERLVRCANPVGGLGEAGLIRAIASDMPDALFKQFSRIVKRFGLDILRQG